MSQSIKSVFYQRLEANIKELGGIFNAHLHLDRAGTLNEKYMESIQHKILEESHVSLHQKHSLINELHQGHAYDSENFNGRVNAYLDSMIAVNTTRADTLIDVTADKIGMTALEFMIDIKRARTGEIDLMVGAYSPFGFKDSETKRWDLIVEGAEQADFIGSLPEADDIRDYPTHIGFYEHCKRFLDLSNQLNKMVHVHTDQRNEPSENGTEQLIKAVREFGAPVASSGEPMIWAIHMISPSTYDEKRFNTLVEGLVECNIGVICCPSAALGMRQLRAFNTPTYNSIPRILELIAAGVHVRLGSDNIADICSPSTTENLIDEIFILSAALRFYHPGILAKLVAGTNFDADEREYVRDHLQKNSLEIEKNVDHIT